MLFVQPDEGAGGDQSIAEGVVFGLGAVDPMNRVGPAKIGHLFHPANEVPVRCERSGGGEWVGCNCGWFHAARAPPAQYSACWFKHLWSRAAAENAMKYLYQMQTVPRPLPASTKPTRTRESEEKCSL